MKKIHLEKYFTTDYPWSES